MARHLIHELVRTVREHPIRASLAALLLLTTTVYVTTDHSRIPVAEVGEEAVPLVDLTEEDSEWTSPIQQASASELAEAPSVVRDDLDQNSPDSQVVPAVAHLSYRQFSQRTRVQPVSGQLSHQESAQKPVWLLGVLIED